MEAAGPNGSAVRPVDSTAIARVELVFVSKTGALASCASLVVNSTTQQNARISTKSTRIDLMLRLGQRGGHPQITQIRLKTKEENRCNLWIGFLLEFEVGGDELDRL